MNTGTSNKPSESQINNYGCFALLFTEISGIIYKSYNCCQEVEKGASQELRRIKQINLVNYVGLVLMPHVCLVFQVLEFLNNSVLLTGLVTFLLGVVALASNFYYISLKKRLMKEKGSVLENLDSIHSMYSNLVSSSKLDFAKFIKKDFVKISFFDDLSEVEKNKMIAALDALGIDLNQLDSAFRHSSFLNINPQLENKELRRNALQNLDGDFKVFENLAS